MSEFFESEIIQQSLEEINNLQEQLYGTALQFGAMSVQERLEHIDMLTNLLEKQKIMYTRLSLLDDPQAIEMKENLMKSAVLRGSPPETSMNTLFSTMEATIKSLRDYVDS